MGAVADDYPAVNVNVLFAQAVYFVQQHIGIHHNAVADDIEGIGPKDAAGYQVKAELALFVDDGMSGVVAAGEPGDDMGVARQNVYDFPFTLVAPLSA